MRKPTTRLLLPTPPTLNYFLLWFRVLDHVGFSLPHSVSWATFLRWGGSSLWWLDHVGFSLPHRVSWATLLRWGDHRLDGGLIALASLCPQGLMGYTSALGGSSPRWRLDRVGFSLLHRASQAALLRCGQGKLSGEEGEREGWEWHPIAWLGRAESWGK